jgi:phage-related minor tail protein
MMNRRQFTSRLAGLGAMVLVLGQSAFLAGCNLWSDILNWIPVGEAALNSILAVLTGNGVIISPAIQALVTTIEAGFTALTAAVKEYQSTVPAPVGALAKVQTAFKDIVDNFGTFLQALTVPNSILGIITGLAGIVLSTIGAFVNKLPVALGAKTSLAGMTLTVNGKAVPVVPQERTRRAFKHAWNGQLDGAKKAGVNIPAKAYLPVSFFEHL